MNICDLPPQTLGEVAASLEIQDLGRLSRTCKRLNDHLKEDREGFDIWENYCRRNGLRKPSNRTIEAGSWKNVVKDRFAWSKGLTELKFKLLLVGDGGVGKTTFVRRFAQNPPSSTYRPSIGVEIRDLPFITTSGHKVTFSVWDSCGQEKLGGLRDGYYIGGQAAIILFDVTSRMTYKDVPNWYRDIVRVCESVPIVLCGNKIDLRDRKVKAKVITFHRKKNLPYFDMSALANYNITAPFLKITEKLLSEPNLIFMSTPPVAPPALQIDPAWLKEQQDAVVFANQIPLFDEDDEDFDVFTDQKRPKVVPKDFVSVADIQDQLFSNKKPTPSTTQSPTCFYVPGLAAKHFHKNTINAEESQLLLPELISITPRLRDYVTEIKSQLVKGKWEVVFFWKRGVRSFENCKAFPSTVQYIESVTSSRDRLSFAYLSFLQPNTTLLPYSAPCNLLLRLCYPLQVHKDKCKVIAEDEEQYLQENQFIIYDPSFVHQIINESTEQSAVMLIVDIWHPELSSNDINSIREIQNL